MIGGGDRSRVASRLTGESGSSARTRRSSATRVRASWSPSRAASAPKTGLGRAWARVRAVAIGRPLASEEEAGERLSKKKALAIFSSDAISSSAYATQEIIRVLAAPAPRRSRSPSGCPRRSPFCWRSCRSVVPPRCRAYPSGGRVRRREGEPQPDVRADRRRGPADRLRHDRRGLDRVGDRPDRRSSRSSTRSRSRSRSASSR